MRGGGLVVGIMIIGGRGLGDSRDTIADINIFMRVDRGDKNTRVIQSVSRIYHLKGTDCLVA